MQVFYRPEQSVTVQSASPSAGKPAQVVADWRERFGASLDFVSFEPVTREDFYRVHDRAYVDGVFTLERSNGFGTRQAEVVEALRYTSGSMRAAALAAWQRGGITVSPTSGFDHAGYAYGGGYCTFNGLVLAALAVLDAGARQLAIIDCDYHYGDGTHDILLRLDLYDQLRHWTLGAHSKANERQVLARLEAALAEAWLAASSSSTRPARTRTRTIRWAAFSAPKATASETGWCSSRGARGRAGGVEPGGWYQEPLRKVLELHAITMEEALAAEGYRSARGDEQQREAVNETIHIRTDRRDAFGPHLICSPSGACSGIANDLIGKSPRRRGRSGSASRRTPTASENMKVTRTKRASEKQSRSILCQNIEEIGQL